jgi:hypothetical protein
MFKMGFDVCAELAYGIAISRDVDIGALLGMAAKEVEEFFCGTHNGFRAQMLSAYDERGAWVFIEDSNTSVYQFDPEPFSQNIALSENMTPERFWTVVGPVISEKFKRAGMAPSWILCLVRS